LNIDLPGKTAVVTGSSEGIGYAIAHGLAATGATVIINGRDRAKVEAAAARLREAFGDGRIRAIAADVGTAAGCAALVESLPVVDLLVNNAGTFKPIDFFETADDVWDAHWHVNVMSGVRLSRAWLPGMEAAGWGRVIFIASESAFNIPVEMIHYGVSKIADVAVARGLAKRMAGTGVTVNSVLPGPTLSEGVVAMLQASGGGSGKRLEHLGADFVREQRPSSILQRPTTVEEVANLVVYVASPLASGTTGAALRVDGGVVDTLYQAVGLALPARHELGFWSAD
jgi:NAD(P)-dependent dehydrogenase (short-subunit alcohol dehydrogenase family)